MLTGVREVRNALAHFRGEISTAQRNQLKFCDQWLDRHQAGISADWPTHTVEQPIETSVIQETPTSYQAGESGREIIPTEEVIGPSDSKYAPLAIWLNSRLAVDDRVQLGFQGVEEVIDGDLPRSAWDHRAWWANDAVGHVQSRQWLDVGWRVAQVNITDAKVTFARIRARERAYISFFSSLQTELREEPDFPAKEASPGGQSWLTVAALPIGGPQLGTVAFSFTRDKQFRVELYIDTGEKDRNKQVFDRIHVQKAGLEAELEPMSWERMDNRRASRIAIYQRGHITDGETRLEELCKWGVDTMCRFYSAIAELATEAFRGTIEG